MRLVGMLVAAGLLGAAWYVGGWSTTNNGVISMAFAAGCIAEMMREP